jgi:hypothetical protein
MSVELIGDHMGSSPGPCGGAPFIGLIGVMYTSRFSGGVTRCAFLGVGPDEI